MITTQDEPMLASRSLPYTPPDAVSAGGYSPLMARLSREAQDAVEARRRKEEAERLRQERDQMLARRRAAVGRD